MRRILFVAAILPLVSLGATSGPTGVTAVAVTSSGFAPASAAVSAGDTVTWTSLDREGTSHQIVFADGSGSPVLQSGQSWSRVFATKGTFAYHDGRHPTLKGTVVVSQGLPSVTLASSLASVGFGGRTALSGKVSSGRAGERVQVFARPCGKLSLSRVATVKTKAGGTYRVLVKPHRNTAYGVRWKKTSSAALQVPVRPLLRLRAASGAYALRAYAGLSLAGRRALLQRFDESEGTWKLAGQVRLKAGGSPSAGTVLSIGTGKATGSGRVRATLSTSRCYAASASNTLSG
jgi:plastocyanin